MSDLTEKWKSGGLEKNKKYYTTDKLGRSYIKTYNKKGFKGLVHEVIAPVPSYEEWWKLNQLLGKCYRFLRLTETKVEAIEKVKRGLVKEIDEVLK